MGTWGYGSFENDAAGDWKDQLVDSRNLSVIVETLSYVVALDTDYYLESDEAAGAVAAAEVVAAMKSGDYSRLPYDEVENWVQEHANLYTPELATLALVATRRVLSDSEIKDLWEENVQAFTKWYNSMVDLQSRLKV